MDLQFIQLYPIQPTATKNNQPQKTNTEQYKVRHVEDYVLLEVLYK